MPKPVTTKPDEKKWEYFHDIAYYHTWRVRRTNERSFNQGFSLINEDEAKALCELLNENGVT